MEKINKGQDDAGNGGRRIFLQQGWFWLKAVAFAAISYPLAVFLGFKVPRKREIVQVNRHLLAGEVFMGDDFVLLQGESEAWALSRICTHLGCRLNYSEEHKRLVCPCHQSQFDLAGKRLEGPARRDLATFEVEVTGSADKKTYLVRI